VDNVKRALDLGAHGVVLPLVGSAEQLREGFAHGRYPPLGARGLSNARANDHSLSLAEYIRASDDEVMIIPIIETAQASANIAEILAVDGLEAVFFGPADLSMSRGFRGVWEGPGVGADILRMNEMARSRGIATAIMGLDLEDIERRELQGFRMLGLGSDVTFLFGRLHDLLVRQRNIQVGLGWK
jgi:2-keto-3-deoxy-L-rhamnonate aldolase RhmA